MLVVACTVHFIRAAVDIDIKGTIIRDAAFVGTVQQTGNSQVPLCRKAQPDIDGIGAADGSAEIAADYTQVIIARVGFDIGDVVCGSPRVTGIIVIHIIET